MSPRKDPEERKKYQREYRLKNIEKFKERDKNYHLKNKEKKNEYALEYRLKNKEKIKEKDKNRYQKRKEKLCKQTRTRNALRKKECIEILGGKCVGCGTTENLQFDHISPSEKSFSIGARLGLSMKKLHEELKKCQLLCVECHLNKTKNEWVNKTIYHGLDETRNP